MVYGMGATAKGPGRYAIRKFPRLSSPAGVVARQEARARHVPESSKDHLLYSFKTPGSGNPRKVSR
jgi:hypothetical protein